MRAHARCLSVTSSVRHVLSCQDSRARRAASRVGGRAGEGPLEREGPGRPPPDSTKPLAAITGELSKDGPARRSRDDCLTNARLNVSEGGDEVLRLANQSPRCLGSLGGSQLAPPSAQPSPLDVDGHRCSMATKCGVRVKTPRRRKMWGEDHRYKHNVMITSSIRRRRLAGPSETGSESETSPLPQSIPLSLPGLRALLAITDGCAT